MSKIDWNAERLKTVLNVAAIREVYSQLQVVGFYRYQQQVQLKVKDPNNQSGSTMHIARTAVKSKEKVFSYLSQFNIYKHDDNYIELNKEELNKEELRTLEIENELRLMVINKEHRKELYNSPEFAALCRRLITQLKVLEQGPLSKDQRKETARNCAQKEIRALLAKFRNKYRISFSESINLAEETLQTLKVEEVMLG